MSNLAGPKKWSRSKSREMFIRGTGEIGESHSSHIICSNGDFREIPFFQWCGNGAGNKYFDDPDFVSTENVNGSVDETKEYVVVPPSRKQ